MGGIESPKRTIYKVLARVDVLKFKEDFQWQQA